MLGESHARIAGFQGPATDPNPLRKQRDSLAWLNGQVESSFMDRLPLEKIVERALTAPGGAERFDLSASPSFYEGLVRQAVRESVELRRKRNDPDYR